MWEDAVDRSGGLPLEKRVARTYNEEPFQYLLSVERERAARANRPLLVMLVRKRTKPGTRALIDRQTSARIFTALSACVREVDFIGWYREDRIIGAVLAQGTGSADADSVQRIAERAANVLSDAVQASLAQTIRIKVVQFVPAPAVGARP
jgi:hypothetical protein